MKALAIVIVLAAACGSASTGLLGIGEIVVKDGNNEMLAVHANGQIQINEGGSWKPIGTLSSDGKMITADGKTGQLQADGTFMTPEGPVPFKLDGSTLVAGATRLTIENGKLVGGNDTSNDVSIVGAETDGTKRTTLLLIGLLMSAQHAESTPPTVTAPPATK
jgi:hypothetical protein